MTQEIECPGKDLEKFILRAEQIPYYNNISGELNKKLVRNKRAYEELIDYYHKAKRLAKQFERGEDFQASLKFHIEICEECSRRRDELREKYNKLEKEKLTKAEKANLRYFGLLERD